MARIQSSCAVGAIGYEAVQGMRHLVADDRKLVNCQASLVFAIDLLVGDETSRSNHVGGHAITDEEHNVLGLSDSCQTAHRPCGNGLSATIVGKGGFVFSWLVQGDLAIRLWGHTNDWGFGVSLGEEIWDGKSQPRKPIAQPEIMETYPQTT